MYYGQEIILFIFLYSITGLILPVLFVLSINRIKSTEKKKSLYGILSAEELYKRMKHLITVEHELPPEVYSYSSYFGWRKEKPKTLNLREGDNGLFSFKIRLGRGYHLKGTVEIGEGKKSHSLIGSFDHSLLLKLDLFWISVSYGTFLLLPFIENIDSIIYFYYFIGPFFCFLFQGLFIGGIAKFVNRDEEKFLEFLKERLLTFHPESDSE